MSLRSRPLSLFMLLGAWLFLAVWPCADAATTLQAQQVLLPGVQLQQVQARLDKGDDGQLHLTLDVAHADVDALGWHKLPLHLQGKLVRSAKHVWYCQGTLHLSQAPGGLFDKRAKFGLILNVDDNTLQLDIGRSQSEAVSLALPLDQLSHVQAKVVSIPLRWLQGPLEKAWSGKLKSGRVSGSMAMDFDPAGFKAAATVHLAKAAFDDGALAAEKLDLDGRLKLDVGAKRSTAQLTSTLHGGNVLLGPIYAQLPQHAAQLALHMDAEGGSTRLDHLRFDDPDTLSLAGGFTFAADGSLHSMSLSRFDARFPKAYARYGKTWLSTLGLDRLRTDGRLQGALVLGSDGPRTFRFRADHLDVADAMGRFHITDLDGGLDWSRKADRPTTSLGWKRLKLYDIPLAASQGRWRSHDGALQLVKGMQSAVLGGQLSIPAFNWRPAAPKGQRLDLSLAVTGVDMRQLSKAFGWPQFHGTLAGAIPGLHYADGRIDLEGGLSLNVFDGFANVTRLSLEHPFGSTPELAADVQLEALNLGAMTDVFDIGKITGALHGSVNQLRLVDWSPVAFKARLLADSGGRISQRAVNNLTSVGGGGVAAGLQGAVLKLFDSFRYKRIGLNCTLTGKVCHMSGLEPDDGGYLIVQGSGLPHLTVIGHESQVSWPTLLTRLQTAIQGAGPVVK